MIDAGGKSALNSYELANVYNLRCLQQGPPPVYDNVPAMMYQPE